MKYKLLKKLSVNDLSESWKAVNQETQNYTFIKKINHESNSLSSQEKKQRLYTSFVLQKKLKVPYFITATEYYEYDDDIYIIYPYLDMDKFDILSQELVKNNQQNILSQMGLLIDFLHTNRIIHGDLKLENFLLERKTKKVKLIDFDFINSIGERPNGLIYGTKSYISLSLMKNETLTPEVDYYSFQHILNTLDNKNKINSVTEKKDFSLSLEMLFKHNFLNADKYKSARKHLFKKYVFYTWKNSYSKNNSLVDLLTSKNKILGFNKEFLQTIFESKLFSHTIQKRILRKLLALVTYKKIGDYWVCTLSVQHHNEIITLLMEFAPVDKIVEFCTVNKYYHMLYLISKLDHSRSYFQLDNKQQDEYKVALAIAQNDFREALNYIHEFSSNRILTSPFLRRNLATAYLQLQQYEKAENFINTWDTKHEQEALNFKAINCLLQNKLEKAEKFLVKAENKFPIDSNAFSSVQSLYYKMILSRYQGKTGEALEICNKILQFSSTEETESLIVSTHCVMSFMMYLTGKYKSASSVASKGLKIINTLESENKKFDLYNSLFYSNLRMGKYGKAILYLNHYLEFGLPENDFLKLTLYNIAVSNNLLASGKIDETLSHTKQILSQNIQIPVNSIQSCHQLLLEATLYKGDTEQFNQFIESTNKVQNDKRETIQKLEISALNMEHSYYYKSSFDNTDIQNLIEKLLSQNSLYNASRLIIVGYLESYLSKKIIFSEDFSPNPITKEESPLFTAVLKMYHHFSIDNSRDEDIILLKSLLTIFQKNNYAFYYGIVLYTIAHIYLETNKYKLSKKYFELAYETFFLIKNVKFQEKIQHQLKIIPTQNTPKNYMEIFEKISQLLVSVEDQYACTKNILTFALHETGAERAVLLVKNRENNELIIKDSIFCDRLSLQDIELYSRSLIQRSFLHHEPLIIDNAQTDERISSFKSIIKHNIQSVLSIPLQKNDQVIGVLYLDHHTIPALFDKDDISFIKTLSNLFAYILTTSSNLHSFKSKTQELLNIVDSVRGKNVYITKNENMKELLANIPQYAKSNAPILLLGESGTGKEILANLFHQYSHRSKQQFIKVNASAIPEKLIESELFGIVDKVATDVKGKIGKFELADGGTLFLDEIGDMPIEVQAKILRAIEYQEFERVGSNKTIRTDIRFIYATNKDLKKMIEKKQFREDLYHRIQMFPIHILPLRHRKEDIGILIDHFVSLFCKHSNPPIFTSQVRILFEKFNWPGNIRQLKNFIQRLCILFEGRTITIQLLPPDIKETLNASTTTSEEVEKTMIVDAMSKHRQNQSRAAKECRMPLSTFRRRLKFYKMI